MGKVKKRQASDEEDAPVDLSDSDDEPTAKKAKTKSAKAAKAAPKFVEELGSYYNFLCKGIENNIF